MPNDILVVGSGGREHALVWKLRQSPKVDRIYVAPGNAGIGKIAQNIAIGADDIKALADFAQEASIHLTIVGPEVPLCLGIVDEFRNRGLRIFGPTQAASWIEGSKAQAKEIMSQAGVPTAPHGVFNTFESAKRHIEAVGAPIVVKASGLAAGKGAVVCLTVEGAINTLKAFMVDKVFGISGKVVVIEEFLPGWEVSLHAVTDGKTYILFPPTQDRKEFRGQNTGGMGVIGPLDSVSPFYLGNLGRSVVRPVLDFMSDNFHPFEGLLYPGLIINENGEFVLEYNCRFGDPETQVYMRLMQSDLFELFEACVEGRLEKYKVQWLNGYCVCVILVSDGYPGKYATGLPISGIKDAEALEDVVVFHCGTKQTNGLLLTNGGRVLAVTATGPTLDNAKEKAYEAVEMIHFPGMQYLDDVGRVHLYR